MAIKQPILSLDLDKFNYHQTMKKHIILLELILITQCSLLAQIPVGHYYDVNGTPMHGYFDPLEYAPEEQWSFTHNSFQYKKGRYYDRKGKRHDGYIKFNFKNIYFSDILPVEKKRKIQKNELQSFVVESDSFFITKSISSEFIAQHIAIVNEHHFIKTYSWVSKMENVYNQKYLYKRLGNQMWIDVPSGNKNFRSLASSIFNNIPTINSRLESKEFDSSSLLTLIKMGEYYEKYQKRENIYFDKFWQDTRVPADKKFHAEILNVKDSVWTVEYFNENIKLYKVNHVSFLPNRIHGKLIAYYDNGKKRKESIYESGKLIKVITYYRNGTVHYNYDLIEINENGKAQILPLYTVVNDSLGKNIIAKTNSGIEEFYDSETGNFATNYFEQNRLKYSFRKDGDRKVYQLYDKDFNFKMKNFGSKLTTFLLEDKEEFFDNQADLTGMYFIYLLIDESGYVEEFKLLNKIEEQVDRAIDYGLYYHFDTKSPNRQRFSRYSIDGEKFAYELVVPLAFDVKKFYKLPSNSLFNYWWNDWDRIWMHDQMLNNMNQIPPVKLPNNIKFGFDGN